MGLCAVLCVLMASCSRYPLESHEELVFAVLDVGQGLSQMGVRGSRSVVWDMGSVDEYDGWLEGYRRLGEPTISAMVISHSDEDHAGGLGALDTGIAFSGMVVVSPVADTSLIRSRAGAWRKRIAFRVKSRGDTLGGLEPAVIECLWPPPDTAVEFPLDSESKNRFSLCSRIVNGESSVLIASDIDSVAMRALARDRRWGLSSQVLVVPHHGSAGAVEPTFYGYVCPRYAVISCARDNTYGHPADNVLDLLFQLRSQVFTTAESGHVLGKTAGAYWRWETAAAE